MKNSWLNIKGSMCLKCPICQYLHISHLIHQKHKRPYSTTHTVTHKFFLVICHTLSRTISCLHSGIPCQTHHSTQVLTCHRLGCDLDVTRLPGIVLSQRGSSLQDALEILLSDTLAESGLPREQIGCLLLLTTLTILSVFPLCTCDSGRPESGVTWRLLGIACGTCA